MPSTTRSQASAHAASRSKPSAPKGTRNAPAPVVRTVAIDVPHAVRGASSGFSVLLIGGISAPLVGAVAPVVGTVWLTLTAVAAFVVSARRIGIASSPMVHGALAAALSYILVLPLLLPFAEGRNPQQIALTFATALSVGACTGLVQARRRA